MLSDNYIVLEITGFFYAFLRGRYFLSQKPGKRHKKAKTKLASGPLFKVDHWLGQKPRKRHKKGQN